MKNIFYFLLFLPIIAMGQSQEATLLDNWQDSTLVGSNAYDNTYNEIWGIVANNREFAVIGSTAGTHFIDVTDATDIREVAFVAGAVQGPSIIHRDYHDYQCYLYAVADEGQGSTIQVIDYSDLPNSVEVVYDSQEHFYRSHNIFIDTSSARLYAAPAATAQNTYILLRVLSLDNPEAPVLLKDYYSIEGVLLAGIHDLYVEKNIAYLNLGGNGFMVADFTDPDAPTYLGGMTSYPQQGYNHSGWLSEDGNTYYLADETHGRDLKAVDVRDLTDISVPTTFNAESTTNSIPHNLIVRGDYLYVSYYYDGLQVYDISEPLNPQRIAHYDTYLPPNNSSYAGAWGVFPYLPSGNILISDMQTGLYVFESVDASITGELAAVGTSENCGNFVSIQEADLPFNEVKISPQPFDHQINIAFTLSEAQNIQLALLDQTGRVVRQLADETFTIGQQQVSYVVSDLPAGMYFLELRGEEQRKVYKVVSL